MSARGAARRWLVPERVQTSGMDCGPAAVTALLEGHGVHASYARIREACQTEVDGSSIDTLEDLLVQLGFEAEQKILPVDHLLHREGGALPSLIVVALPNGLTHFVVLWRAHGSRVQVMDPASGRRWPTRAELLREVFVHEMSVPAEDFRQWAKSGELLRPLIARMGEVGVGDAEAIVAEAQSRPGLAIAALDAATRMSEALCQSGALRRGVEAGALCRALYARALDEPASIPARYWFARPAEDPSQVVLRGAIAVVVRGRRAPEEVAAEAAPLPKELAAALSEPPARPWTTLFGLAWNASGMRVGLVGAMMVLTSLTTLFEALVLRGMIDLSRLLQVREQRVAGLIAVIILFTAALGLDLKLLDLVQRIGRALECELRMAFLSKAPRLGLRYFRSRPASDMAARIHETHRVRALPETVSELVRDALGVLAILVGIAWVDPSSLLPALSIAVASLLVPALLQPAVSERELRMRSHGGAMLFATTDALLGMMPLRAHVGERALRREHEQVLSEWLRCGRRLLGLGTAGEALVGVVRVAGLAWLLFGFLERPQDQRAMLLVSYWVLFMGTLGRRLVGAVRQLAPLRNITLRVLEPLGAPEVGVAASLESAEPPESKAGGAAIELAGVSLHAGGRRVLEDIDLRIDPGEHVAIVGVSGGGKTSLVALLLGLYAPSSGVVRVDGSPVSEANRDRRTATTVWVDPAVHLWNDSLVHNLLYGASSNDGVGRALETSDLLEVAERLPDGMHSFIGEGGRLLSGGQGQRVRFGRGVMRSQVRLAILDEAFRGLELERRKTLLSRARERWSSATLISVTHDVHDTIDMPRVLVVEQGRIVEDGSPRALMDRPGSRYRALCDADQAAQDALWAASRWRSWHVVRGTVDEASRQA